MDKEATEPSETAITTKIQLCATRAETEVLIVSHPIQTSMVTHNKVNTVRSRIGPSLITTNHQDTEDRTKTRGHSTMDTHLNTTNNHTKTRVAIIHRAMSSPTPKMININSQDTKSSIQTSKISILTHCTKKKSSNSRLSSTPQTSRPPTTSSTKTSTRPDLESIPPTVPSTATTEMTPRR